MNQVHWGTRVVLRLGETKKQNKRNGFSPLGTPWQHTRHGSRMHRAFRRVQARTPPWAAWAAERRSAERNRPPPACNQELDFLLGIGSNILGAGEKDFFLKGTNKLESRFGASRHPREGTVGW